MADSALTARTFRRALQIVGGPRQLTRRLRVPMADLAEWLAGEDLPPTAVFLAAIDIVLSELDRTAVLMPPERERRSGSRVSFAETRRQLA
jgi:hypothetical protein